MSRQDLPTDEPRQMVHVRLSRSSWEVLRAESRSRRLSMSLLMQAAVDDWIDNHAAAE
jgi:hypothetical protein